ncbi:MBL fold metallo-hydrolase [Bacillus sp. FJAT-45350]|uniref:MBL fold metallo-hydrolase n=1 Tax=Bacillus sp. FJAT-45350 TaxID=2011014 RepID=UPI0015CBC4CD|nr:MBL fold metallo-hydrolase [Bacillus sp. FJAT-45350]
MEGKVKCLEIPTPFLVGPVNVYLVEGEALTLVDTGPKTDEALHSMKEQLSSFGYLLSDIEQVVVTHHHPDHVGLVDVFSDKVPIIGHVKNRPWLTQDQGFRENMYDFFQKLYTEHGLENELFTKIKQTQEMYMTYSCHSDVDIEVGQGDEVQGLAGWKVIETPGHAQSHISLHNETTGELIAGDHLIAKISSNAIIEAPYEAGEEREKTLIQYRDALKYCKELDVSKYYPGHGQVIVNGTELIDERLQGNEERALTIQTIIGKEKTTCFDIVQKLFPKMYMKQPALTFSEVLGHLDLLEQREKVEVEKVEGIIYYRNRLSE